MALTVNDRFTSVDGPIKTERVHVTSDGTDDDTLASLLQNPITVSIESVNTDLAATAATVSATLSGKVATLRDPAAQAYLVTFVGF